MFLEDIDAVISNLEELTQMQTLEMAIGRHYSNKVYDSLIRIRQARRDLDNYHIISHCRCHCDE